MAIYVSCPDCRRTLAVPEGGGGQRAKCPECLKDFVIPGAVPVAPAVSICAVAVPDVRTVTEGDVDHARSEAAALAAEHVSLCAHLAQVGRRRRRQESVLASLRTLQSSRETLDHSLGRVGGFCIAVTLGGAGLTLLASPFASSALTYMTVIFIGMLAGGTAYMPFSFLPGDEKLSPLVEQWTQTVRETNALYDPIAAQEATLSAKLSAAEAEYVRLKTIFESRLHWLLTCQWRQMTGVDFERFLAQVFEERGYLVEATGRTGDQGVDLIVIRNGTRAAIQAKGYLGTTVGNEAVQQVHAGKTFHHCQTAVVVTTSTFSPSARALADRVGCKLVDGSQIPDLITGRLVI